MNNNNSYVTDRLGKNVKNTDLLDTPVRFWISCNEGPITYFFY